MTDAGGATKSYGDYLINSERVLLEDWAIHLRRMFGTPFLVGSVLTTRDYRDVDVRVLLDSGEWEALFPGLEDTDPRDAKWSGICTAISVWGQKVTGLPVDFQIQPRDKANEQFDGRRNAMGLGYHGYEIVPLAQKDIGELVEEVRTLRAVLDDIYPSLASRAMQLQDAGEERAAALWSAICSQVAATWPPGTDGAP